MKRAETIFEQGDHRWIAVTRDPERPHHLIDTNEYLVASDGHALLCDPGGLEIFPAVFAAINEKLDPSGIDALFASHQDPDIISSLALWLEFKPDMRCYTSWLWCGFIPHFGGDAQTFVPIADEGMTIQVGATELRAHPAHYLHSSGNFHLHDPKAKLLFSGDVGAALLPNDESALFVTDFDRHIRHAEAFHKRWMGSEPAKRDWCERTAQLGLDMLCPQHGAIYQGADVDRFINWFAELEIGRIG